MVFQFEPCFLSLRRYDLARVEQIFDPASKETTTTETTTGVGAAFPPGALPVTAAAVTFEVKEVKATELAAPPDAASFTPR